VIFLVAFTALLIGVIYFALLPGMDAASQPNISDDEKRRLVAWYRLLLFVVLFILFAGLVLTVRFARFFSPRDRPPIARTPYVDAWAESAKRVQVPPDAQEQADEG